MVGSTHYLTVHLVSVILMEIGLAVISLGDVIEHLMTVIVPNVLTTG